MQSQTQMAIHDLQNHNTNQNNKSGKEILTKLRKRITGYTMSLEIPLKCFIL